MNDASAEFQIKVVTAADLAGMRDVTAEMDKLGGATAVTTAGTKQLILAHKDAADAVEGHAHSNSTLRLATRGANDAAWALTDLMQGNYLTAFHRAKFAVEDLGIAMRTALFPTAVIAGITIGIELLSHLVTSTEEATDKTKKLGDEHKETADKLADSVVRSEKSLRALKEYLDEATAAAKRLRSAEDELGDAQLAEKLAAVEEQEAKGELTGPNAARLRAKLRAANEQDRNTRQIAEAKANEEQIGKEMDYLAEQKESNHRLAELKQRMDAANEASKAFITNTGAVNLELLERYQTAKEEFEKKQRSIDLKPEDIEKRSGELSQKLAEQENQIKVAEIRERTTALKKAAADAEAAKKEQADATKERDQFEKATRDIRKKMLEEEKAGIAAQLADAEAHKDAESEHFGEQVQHIAELKKKLLDVSVAIGALEGAANPGAQARRDAIDFAATKEVVKGELKEDKAENAGAGRGAHAGGASAGTGAHAIILGPDGSHLGNVAWTGGAGIGSGAASHGGSSQNGNGGLVTGHLSTGHVQGASMAGGGTDFDDFHRFRIDTSGGHIDTSPGFIDTAPRSPSRRSTLPADQQAALSAANTARENQDILDPGMLGELRSTVNSITRNTGSSDSMQTLVGLMQEIAAAMEKNKRDHESLDLEVDTLRSQIKNGRN